MSTRVCVHSSSSSIQKQTVLRDEQQVKAQLRHKHALAQVKLEKVQHTCSTCTSYYLDTVRSCIIIKSYYY